MKYRIDLTDFTEEIFEELERINESGHGHELVIEATDRKTAAQEVGRLMVPFYQKHFDVVS